ncbi:hypothetical protein ADUPG1_010344 [Aduncisulcus paluster]|uniref:CCHC-type domain-containing protein n=1 Tax=Aduncisulcus paluster TaxID=2918883 RepID=A0ABQ5JR00_9EUKA|nr:hypothetical protein ADUPG1_010344 [Aduncisulcus paluster]
MIFAQQAIVTEGIEEFQRYCSVPAKRHSSSADRRDKTEKKEKSFHKRTGPPKDLSKIRCFNCQAMGHFAKDCPVKRKAENKGRQKFKAFSSSNEETQRPIISVQILGDGTTVLSEQMPALLDSGATCSFIGKDNLLAEHFVPQKLVKSEIELGDGRKIQSTRQVSLRLRIHPVTTCSAVIIRQTFTVIPMQTTSEEIIFGYPDILKKGLLDIIQQPQKKEEVHEPLM